MTREDAERLADRIGAHWGQQFSNAVFEHWVSMLCRVEDGAAGTVYARLQSRERCPSPADFQALLRSLQTHDRGNPKAVCDRCNGDGVISDTRHPSHWPGDSKTVPSDGSGECLCNVSVWCPQCDDGAKVKAWMGRV